MSSWLIKNKSRDSFDYDTPSTNTVQSDSLNAVERFVREVIGNSRDSSLDNSIPVKVEFSLMDIKGAEKAQFVSSTKLDSLRDSYLKLEESNDHLSRVFHGKNPTKVLFDPDTNLRLLIVRDSNTKGLIGPEYQSSDNENMGDQRFIGLCRSTGKNSTSEGQDSTGSWGYGKSVIWANNISRIVFFNSRLSIPASYNNTSIEQRLFGHALLPDHIVDNDIAKDGKVFFGDISNDEVFSVWNNNAVEFVDKINIEDFKTSESGTSIMIVGFEPGDGDEYDSSLIIDQLKDAVAKYFWPAIISNELEVSLKYNNEALDINIQRNSDYATFIKAYKKIIDGPSNEDKNFKLIKAEGPVSMNSFKGKIALYAKKVDENNPPPMVNKIAKIRGTKMVIEYADPRIPSVSGIQTIGVALAGSLIGHLNGVSIEPQRQLDKLLRKSEPISHHKWDHKNQKLKQIRAKSVVENINRNILKSFKSIVKESREELTGDQTTLLSRIFNLGGSSSGPGPRGGETEYRTLKNMEKDIGEQNSRYTHSIVFKTKPKASYRRVEGGLQVTHIGFDAKFFAVDELGSSLKEYDSVLAFKPVSVLSKTYDDDTYQNFTEKSSLESADILKPIPLDSKYREYEVEFQSEEIPNDVFGIFIIRPNFEWMLGRPR